MADAPPTPGHPVRSPVPTRSPVPALDYYNGSPVLPTTPACEGLTTGTPTEGPHVDHLQDILLQRHGFSGKAHPHWLPTLGWAQARKPGPDLPPNQLFRLAK